MKHIYVIIRNYHYISHTKTYILFKILKFDILSRQYIIYSRQSIIFSVTNIIAFLKKTWK